MTTGERMKQRRKEIGLSAEIVAERLGVSPATIYRYENGDIDKVPGERLAPIANILQTTPAQLMGWDSAVTDIKNIFPLPESRSYPLIGTIACGEPILAEENISEYIQFPGDINADFCLRCKGDSMINARIYDGDIVFIRKQDHVETGEIAAVRIGDEATLKRVYYVPGSDRVTLRACNPLFPDMEFEGDTLNDMQIIGKAVSFLSTVR